MLSYQHSFHAGNAADVHKHALLATMLAYLVRKDKPLTYLETHAGRGLYDLHDAAARKTGEAASGILRLADAFPCDHPYRTAVEAIRSSHGPQAYPGSPLIAAHLLRPVDRMHLAELHPAEHAALSRAGLPKMAQLHPRDGFAMAYAQVPPTPRRGLMLIDPSYEVKDDYDRIPVHLDKLARAWNVGIIALWYPILRDARHAPMLKRLATEHPEALRHEVAFPAARSGHGMVGSGLFVLRPTFGLAAEAARLTRVFSLVPRQQR
jgi:23S rRNA (adenine2030-N6)-methyltransferase